MTKHIIIWPLKEETTDEQKVQIKARLEGLVDVIDELKVMEVGADGEAGTMSLYSEFDSREGLAAYQIHLAHQEVAAFVRSCVSGRSVCDYDC